MLSPTIEISELSSDVPRLTEEEILAVVGTVLFNAGEECIDLYFALESSGRHIGNGTWRVTLKGAAGQREYEVIENTKEVRTLSQEGYISCP